MMMIAVTDRSVSAIEEGSEIGFAVNKRHPIAPVAVQQVEDEIDETDDATLSDAFWIR